jgi:hypothetical protein
MCRQAHRRRELLARGAQTLCRTRRHLLDRVDRLAETQRQLAISLPVDARRNEHVALLVGQRVESPAEMLAVSDSILAARQPRLDVAVLERSLAGMAGAAAIVQNQAVRDLEEPWREGTLRIIGVARAMDAKEELLLEIARQLGRGRTSQEERVQARLVAPEELFECPDVFLRIARHEGLVGRLPRDCVGCRVRHTRDSASEVAARVHSRRRARGSRPVRPSCGRRWGAVSRDCAPMRRIASARPSTAIWGTFRAARPLLTRRRC